MATIGRQWFWLALVLLWIAPQRSFGQHPAQIRAEVERSMNAQSEALAAFYRQRDYRPAWMEHGKAGSAAADLIDLLRDARRDGLDPDHYQATEWAARIEAMRLDDDPVHRAALEVAMTDAFFRYASDLSGGRVMPSALHPGWEATAQVLDVPALLQEALAHRRWEEAAGRLRPPYPDYQALRDALAQYRRLQAGGGWPLVPEGIVLESGDHAEAVPLLRNRLAVTEGSLPAAEVAVFDDTLAAAVRAFQRRHGLEADGIVGPQTLAALNVPVGTRIRQIEVNMERWRWLPRPPEGRYLLVNVVGGWLRAVEADTTALVMKVIAGKRSTPTPLFHSAIEGVVLAPYWNVPTSIARNEILPRLGRDPGYLARHHMRRLPGGQLRQDPGPTNPLGRLKFVFPNRFSVGLHDTPERQLFQRSDCAFSHGCIRLEQPVELALFALQDDPAWPRPRLEAVIGRWKEIEIPLPQPIPVFVLYWTTWVDEQGTLHFRPDLYGHDQALEGALGSHLVSIEQ